MDQKVTNHSGSFRKKWLIFRVIFGILKRSKNGSKMAQKSLEKGQKGLRKLLKYHETVQKVQKSSNEISEKCNILLQNEPLCCGLHGDLKCAPFLLTVKR